MNNFEKVKADHQFIRDCIVRYKNIPFDSIGHKDWTKAIPLYYDIEQRVGIRNLNKFIAYLESIAE